MSVLDRASILAYLTCVKEKCPRKILKPAQAQPAQGVEIRPKLNLK